MVQLYAHDDRKHWGRAFVHAAGRAGIQAHLFKNAAEVPEGARAFVRLDQEGQERGISKNMVAALHARGVKTLPTAQEADWYDDKWFQYNSPVGIFMPTTIMAQHPERARWAAQELGFPLVSKSREGSASKNVRLIENERQLENEIAMVFGGPGILMTYGRRQHNYLMLQKFIPNNMCDYRVYVTGNMYWGAVRQNAPGTVFASGSGIKTAINDFTDHRALAAFNEAYKVTQLLQTKWMAYDFVFDGDAAYLLEFSSSWPPHWCPWAPCFIGMGDGKFMRNGQHGGHMFDIAVDILWKMKDDDGV